MAVRGQVEIEDLNRHSDELAVGAIPVVFAFTIGDVASADTDITMKRKVRVIDAWFQKVGGNAGAANTYTVKSTGNAITDAMNGNVNDNLLARAAEINDANSEVPSGGILRVSHVKAGGDAEGIVYVQCLPL